MTTRTPQVRPRITPVRPQPAYRPRYQPTPADRIVRRICWGVVGFAVLYFGAHVVVALVVALGKAQ